MSASTTLAQVPEDFPAIIKGIVTTLGAASRFAQVTRFNWGAMVRGDMDEFFTAWDSVDERVKATQILTLIDKLPSEEKRAARFFYEMLCDYVHRMSAHTRLSSARRNLCPRGKYAGNSAENQTRTKHCQCSFMRWQYLFAPPFAHSCLILNSCSTCSATLVNGSDAANLWQRDRLSSRCEVNRPPKSSKPTAACSRSA